MNEHIYDAYNSNNVSNDELEIQYPNPQFTPIEIEFSKIHCINKLFRIDSLRNYVNNNHFLACLGD